MPMSMLFNGGLYRLPLCAQLPRRASSFPPLRQRQRWRFCASSSSSSSSRSRSSSSSSFSSSSSSRFSTSTSSLALSGGNSYVHESANVKQAMLDRIAQIDSAGKPHRLVYSKDDILPFSSDLVFVQSGMRSQSSAWHQLMNTGLPKSRVVAIVRDVFDLSPERPTLQDIMRPVRDDVVAVHSCIFDPLRRRLVNEYTLQADGTRALTRHDVNLHDYLHTAGLRVVPVDDVAEFNPDDIMAQQSTNHILMVAPVAFAFNADAAIDNKFINPVLDSSEASVMNLRKQVRLEFSSLHSALVDAGVQVQLFAQSEYNDTPDAVFPNNWFSTHTDFEVDECTLVLYPMKVPSRRRERRPQYIERVLMFRRYKHVLDMSHQENAREARFLEGTGSLVLDRIRRVAYLAISERSNLSLAQKWSRMMGYSLVPFFASDPTGSPIYHTNVMMAVGTKLAVVCSESVQNKAERNALLDSLSQHHDVIDISWEQVLNFCGNVLELEDHAARQVMAMSTRAYNAFSDKQKEVILKHVHKTVHADISTLEEVGGGGVRCTIAELF